MTGDRSRLSRRALLIGALVVAVGGCAHLEERSRIISLQNKARAFMKMLRWGNFEAASVYLRNRDGSVPKVDLERLQAIRVTNADHVVDAASRESTVAELNARFDYQLVNSATVKTLNYRVTWWFDEEEEKWFVEGGLPNF
jgi:hypothetical protein